MDTLLWLAVVILSAEALFFGNGAALVAGLITAAIGMILEIRKYD